MRLSAPPNVSGAFSSQQTEAQVPQTAVESMSSEQIVFVLRSKAFGWRLAWRWNKGPERRRAHRAVAMAADHLWNGPNEDSNQANLH